MLRTVPRNVIDVSAVPSPAVNTRPTVVGSVKVPFVVETVTSTWLDPASVSTTKRSPGNTSAVSSLVAAEAGRLLTGATLPQALVDPMWLSGLPCTPTGTDTPSTKFGRVPVGRPLATQAAGLEPTESPKRPA